MAKFEYEGKVYRPECINCGSHNVTRVENTKGYHFRCNACKTKSRYFEDMDALMKNPGMFKPGYVMDVKVDDGLREQHLHDTGKLTEADREFLAGLKERRESCLNCAVYTLWEERYEPCWEELAECWELYDPVTKQALAYIDEPIDDAGRLKCIPVKKAEAELTNSTFLLRSEAESVAEGLPGVTVKEGRTGIGDALADLMEIVARVDWQKA